MHICEQDSVTHVPDVKIAIFCMHLEPLLHAPRPRHSPTVLRYLLLECLLKYVQHFANLCSLKSEDHTSQSCPGSIVPMPPFKSLLLCSVTATLLEKLGGPKYAPTSSWYATNVIWFLLLVFGWIIWRWLIYPKLFSPPRHLPQAPVSSVCYKEPL